MQTQRMSNVAQGPFDCLSPSEGPCGQIYLPKSWMRCQHYLLAGVERTLEKSQGNVFAIQTGEEQGVFGKGAGELCAVRSPDPPALQKAQDAA